MGCMEHICLNPKCDHLEINNDSQPRQCPKCKDPRPMLRTFDEVPEDFDMEDS